MDLFQNSVRFWRKPPLSVIFRGAEKIFPFVFDKNRLCRWIPERSKIIFRSFLIKNASVGDFSRGRKNYSVRFWRKSLLSAKIEQREEFQQVRFHRQSLKIAKTNGKRNVKIQNFTDRAWKSQKRTEWEMWRLKKSPTELKKTKNERNLKCEHWKEKNVALGFRRQRLKISKTNGNPNENAEISDFLCFSFSLFFIFLAIFLYRFRSSGSTLALVELLAASLANAEFLIKQAQRARRVPRYNWSGCRRANGPLWSFG